MQFYLIRHGETDWNRLGRIQGNSDIPLNEAGREQARRLAETFPLEHPEVGLVFSSPLCRARETAETLAAALGCAVELIPEARELSFGAFEGLTWAEALALDPAGYEAVRRAELFDATPGGETVYALLFRVLTALERVGSGLTEDAALVTHGGLIRRTLRYCFPDQPLANDPTLKNGDYRALPLSVITEALERLQQEKQ